MKALPKKKLLWLFIITLPFFIYFIWNGPTPKYSKVHLENKIGLRILTQNIAHGRGQAFHQYFTSKAYRKTCLNSIASLTNDSDIDLALFQEIDFDAPWTDHENQLEAIKAKSNLKYGYEGNNNVSEGFMQHKYGNAYLSKSPALKSEAISFDQSKMGGKGFIYLKLNFANTHLHIINLHLHHYDETERKRQFAMISDFIDKLPNEPKLIGGDFNTIPENQLIQDFMKKYDLIRSDLPAAKVPTFETFSKRRIDLFLYTKDLTITQMAVIKHTLSDHHGVIIDLSLNN